ncbi:MAG: helix-turn-helix domain-containing protein [Spirochaetota bacterium]
MASLDRTLAAGQADLFTSVTGVPCVVLDRTGSVLHPHPNDSPCRLCRTIAADAADEPQAPAPDVSTDGARHLKWVEEAMRFGGRSIFMCGNAFTHWTAPIVDGARMIGALVAGPVLTIEEEGFFENELLARFSGDHSSDVVEGLRSLYERVPQLEPARVTLLSQLLLQLAIAISRDTSDLRDSEDSLAQQSRINEYIQALKTRRESDGVDPDLPSYPVEKETKLLNQIRSGDVPAAQKTLNELLGHVFFATGSRLDQTKLRARELVVLLSRAVLTEGADPEEVFGLNYQFVDAIDQQSNATGVAYWMARIIRRFADLILYLPHLTHARTLRRALSYMRAHANRPVRVAEVARAAGLSSSHFSRVFAAEMGETFVSYLNRIRCEQASELLRTTSLPVQEIAHRCGFSDHSYFTKVFRSITGAPPSAHREG